MPASKNAVVEKVKTPRWQREWHRKSSSFYLEKSLRGKRGSPPRKKKGGGLQGKEFAEKTPENQQENWASDTQRREEHRLDPGRKGGRNLRKKTEKEREIQKKNE